MKVRAERAALVEALTWVAQVAPRHSTTPILSGIRFSVAMGKLTFTSYDYETSHEATIDADHDDPIDALVPGSFCRDVVTSLKGDVVELIIEEGRLTASAGRSTYRVQILDPTNYPNLPKFPNRVGTIDADGLRRLVGIVAHACDTGNALEAVRGIRIEGTTTELTMLATDRFVLGIASAGWSGGDLAATTQAPALVGALKGLAGEVTIGHDGGLLGLRDAARAVTVRCFSEAPDDPWVKIPKLMRPDHEDALAVQVDTTALLDALKRAGKLDNDTRVSIAITSGELEVSAEGSEKGDGTEVLDIDHDGPEMRFLMGARRFADSIAAAGTPTVRLGLLEPRKPVTIRPVPDDDHTALLVMPRHKN